MDIFTHKTKLVFAGILIVANIFLLSLLIPAISGNNTASASSTAPSYAVSAYDSPNAVTNGMGTMFDGLNYLAEKTENSLSTSLRSVATGTAQSGRYAAMTGEFIGNGAYATVTGIGRVAVTTGVFTGRAIAGSILFTVKLPLSILGFVSNAPVVSAVIKPAASEQVPAIEPYSSTLYARRPEPAPVLQVAVQKVQKTPQIDTTPAWPMRGAVTTFFGVPHWPYQPTHTGMDISDGQPSGVTPIKPFKPGRVIEAVNSNIGLGNRVILDHGGGLTSVYAHMYSVNVTMGQEVDKNTMLGLEGSSGASTGPHVHLEIRQNGQPRNPQDYIAGLP